MDKTIVVTVANLTLKQHVTTAFCESLDKAKACVAELEVAYPGESYRLMVSPPLAELEDRAVRELHAIFREAFLMSGIMRPHNNVI